MDEVDANRHVRELCQEIVEEQDPERVEELIAALKNALKSSHDEARLRMSFMARHFRGQLQAVSPSEGAERLSQDMGKIRAVLGFLGLGAGMRLGRETEG